ncbi:hypothetical protein [Mycobacterium sp. 1482292.6]|uniref:hypothetical protein n=1 Tax=Mycobacterium sp. 1482292.6 TaxID=1834081 RepID=UPI000A501D46|nr:hypothetical protein [Mycobacterium sp. 1482292.6]
METVVVSAAELAELARIVGVDPGSDWETIRAAADKLLAEDAARRKAENRSQVEKVLEAEDRRLVAAAVNDGRLTAQSAQSWRDALKRDRPGNRLVLASLAPGIRPDGRIGAADPDSDLEDVYNRLMAPWLGGQTKSVAASQSQLHRPRRAAPSRPANSAEMPARTKADIDADPTYRHVAWNLGARFRDGLKPPESTYHGMPAINDDYTPELIENGDGTAYWKPKPVRGN